MTSKLMKILLTAFALLILPLTAAEAKKVSQHKASVTQTVTQYDRNGMALYYGSDDAVTTSRMASTARTRYEMAAVQPDPQVVGGRPPGCPHRFCGCEASLYVFGEIRKELNLASNWIRKFPRTQAAPGMVAARSGHVFVLKSHVEGKEWLVHDGNSGGGKTRVHVRSIAGYVIVNPHASRMASLSHVR